MRYRHAKAFLDTSAWILILPAIIALYWIDDSMLRTLLEWVIFAPALAGIAILISRIVFPQVNLSETVQSALDDHSMPAAVVAAAVIGFVGLVFFALIFWARA